ncbi:MAG TPA: hypothetical protein VM344_09425 [Vitreimonas sp.]|nr:hypothetical protein [Vitreimonas sp.]
MPAQPRVDGENSRDQYTVVAEPIEAGAWHVTVRELSATWTVAFDRDELEGRARERIALDLRCHPTDFDIRIIEVRGGG